MICTHGQDLDRFPVCMLCIIMNLTKRVEWLEQNCRTKGGGTIEEKENEVLADS